MAQEKAAAADGYDHTFKAIHDHEIPWESDDVRGLLTLPPGVQVKVLNYDPVMKSRTLWHHDTIDDTTVIRNEYDIEDVLEFNKLRFNRIDERQNWKGDIHHVASIPIGVYMDMMRNGRIVSNKDLRKWLDDKDQLPFRTRPGRLSR